MRFVSISDVHIREVNDLGYRSLVLFFEHPLTKNATHIGLLGDIFDLMAGNHLDYVLRWSEIFNYLKNFLEEGKIIYYAEGNHDMHLNNLFFNKVFKNLDTKYKNNFHLLMSDTLIYLGDRKVIIGHGDEYNQHDQAYLKYKNIIKKRFFSYIANYMMPFFVLNYFGRRASIRSRKYGQLRFDEHEIKLKFRNGAFEMVSSKASIVVGGHSHILDDWKMENFHYLNNGFPPVSHKFVVIDNEQARLEKLEVFHEPNG